ncbi:hypothetical protein ACSYAD_31740 [Acaryochloris marina NIES-2412]|uniref:hypothetical protein n=1 Tax=Acaryochloris marina TaxID=155978 RepID=UPI004058D81C
MKHIKIFFGLSKYALAALFLTGCFGGPDSSSLVEFIESEDTVKVQDIQLKVINRFSGGEHLSYRTLFMGKGKLTEDLIYLAQDWHQDCNLDYRKTLDINTSKVYKLSRKKGESVKFEGIVAGWIEDGSWQFSAYRLDYLDKSDESIRGVRASAYTNPIVVGTESFRKLCQSL